MVFGTPTMSMPTSWSLLKMFIVPSPPMAINPSSVQRLRLRIALYDMSWISMLPSARSTG